MSLNQSYKKLFPVFDNNQLIYLDSASTSQKPGIVIEREKLFYELENANVHRGFYSLSAKATQNFEAVRKSVADFIGANSLNEIAFTKGTTESINIVANSFNSIVKPGDNIVVTETEHHANYIPWQQVCKRNEIDFRVIPVNKNGELGLSELKSSIDSKTKLLTITHLSNVTGCINPIDEIAFEAHKKNVPVLIDVAQSAGHMPINVSSWNADFVAFSAHKMFGPMGVGVLYVNEKHHPIISPLNFGGGIVKDVEKENTTFQKFPRSVEAGTPNVAGVIGLGAALEFLSGIDLNESFKQSQNLAMNLREGLIKLGFVKMVGQPQNVGPVVSFTVEDIHPHDVAAFLADRNICVRAGHHCAQPLHRALNISASVRASFSIYNSMDDVDAILLALKDLKKFWQ